MGGGGGNTNFHSIATVIINSFPPPLSQYHAPMELFDWLAPRIPCKEEWNSVLMECGAQSVMTSGEWMMLEWCAGNSGSLHAVSVSQGPIVS